MWKILFWITLLFTLLPEGLGCGKKFKGVSIGKQPFLKRTLGDVTPAPFAGAPIANAKCEDLSCNFDSQCCWANAQDQLEWTQASGKVDPKKTKKSLGTETVPEGNFLLVFSETAGTADQVAQFYSCPIECSEGDITVKLKHWESNTVSLQVCTETSPQGPVENCKDVPKNNGNVDTVTVPGSNQPTNVVIVAKGFTPKNGSLAIVQNIEVQCSPCSTTTAAPEATTSPSSSPGTPPPVATPPCSLECDFEAGNTCAYQLDPSSSADQNWAPQPPNPGDKYQNRLTGVVKPDQGNKYGASYFKAKQGQQAIMAADSNFDSAYVIKYKYYLDTDGISIAGCCDDVNTCTPAKGLDVAVKDYQTWQEGAFECKSGTKKVFFKADNAKGNNEGAAAVDDVKVYQSTGGSPADATTPACGGAAGRRRTRV